MIYDYSKTFTKNNKIFLKGGKTLSPIFKCPMPPEDPDSIPTSFEDLDIAIQNCAIAKGYYTLDDLKNVQNLSEFLGQNCTVERLDLRVFPNVVAVKLEDIAGLNSLASLNLGNVYVVGPGKANGFPVLTEIYGDNLTTFDSSGPSPLRGLYELETVSFPNLTTCTGYFAFANTYSSIKTLSLPNYEGFTDYMFTHQNETEPSPNGNAFELEKVYLPKIKFAGVLMFKNCTKLSTIYIPEVETIAGGAFLNCKSLKEIHLEKVTKFVKKGDNTSKGAEDGNNPFDGCNYSNLKVYLGETPPQIIDNIAKKGETEITIVVPSEEAKALYQANPWWGSYTNIIVKD